MYSWCCLSMIIIKINRAVWDERGWVVWDEWGAGSLWWWNKLAIIHNHLTPTQLALGGRCLEIWLAEQRSMIARTKKYETRNMCSTQNYSQPSNTYSAGLGGHCLEIWLAEQRNVIGRNKEIHVPSKIIHNHLLSWPGPRTWLVSVLKYDRKLKPRHMIVRQEKYMVPSRPAPKDNIVFLFSFC